ncbi:hypothetical protein [Altererythrobacter sp. Root672]|uniref:hypothetical protein n=1 Tax=Altererythrobacter sp. Root672 TaxID=1736584 RepID=UPI0006F85DBB|nr:hypothetical protein [Altererythrobacter sp. Root672]KRA79745.1 hypothetical protein ASD76_17145 [Altererythrobacter sp. Root672]
MAHFTAPNAGWIRLRIEPLHDLYAISCTHIYDPFDDLVVWLEQIASGSAAATWCVNQEGSVSRLQFYGGVVDDRADYLLHVQSDKQGIARIRGVRVVRSQLVESLYCSFRLMADDPNYQAREWEAHPQFQLLDDLGDDEYTREIRRFPYSGRNLREVTSATLAAYLSENDDPDQS